MLCGATIAAGAAGVGLLVRGFSNVNNFTASFRDQSVASPLTLSYTILQSVCLTGTIWYGWIPLTREQEPEPYITNIGPRSSRASSIPRSSITLDTKLTIKDLKISQSPPRRERGMSWEKDYSNKEHIHHDSISTPSKSSVTNSVNSSNATMSGSISASSSPMSSTMSRSLVNTSMTDTRKSTSLSISNVSSSSSNSSTSTVTTPLNLLNTIPLNSNLQITQTNICSPSTLQLANKPSTNISKSHRTTYQDKILKNKKKDDQITR